MMDLWQHLRSGLLAGLCCAGPLFLAGPAAHAEISARTIERDYRVRGLNARTLVSYMRRRPFAGDNGPAMANIRPRYDLKVETAAGEGRARDTRKAARARGCRVDKVSLSIRFTMTLPHAVQESRLDHRTKRAWRSFRSFTRRHEETHRRIYLRCARGFLRKAAAMSSQNSCYRLKREVRRLLDREDKACNRLHDAFDRRDFPRVRHMPLFRLARQEPARHPARHKGTEGSRTWFDAARITASPIPVRLRNADLR